MNFASSSYFNLVVGIAALTVVLSPKQATEATSVGYCPSSAWTCLQATDQETKRIIAGPSPAGLAVHLTCHDDDDHAYETRNFPEEHVPYPSNYSICQENGTWSNADPVCIRKAAPQDPQLWVRMEAHCKLCNGLDCPQTWAKIGEYRSLPRGTGDVSETWGCVYEFPYPIYLSAAVFNNVIKGANDFTLRVDGKDVINSYSVEAERLHDDYSHYLKKHEPGLRGGSKFGLYRLGARTDKVFLGMTAPKRNELISMTSTFYGFPPLKDCTKKPVSIQPAEREITPSSTPSTTAVRTAQSLPWWGWVLVASSSLVLVGGVVLMRVQRQRFLRAWNRNNQARTGEGSKEGRDVETPFDVTSPLNAHASIAAASSKQFK